MKCMLLLRNLYLRQLYSSCPFKIEKIDITPTGIYLCILVCEFNSRFRARE